MTEQDLIIQNLRRENEELKDKLNKAYKKNSALSKDNKELKYKVVKFKCNSPSSINEYVEREARIYILNHDELTPRSNLQVRK